MLPSLGIQFHSWTAYWSANVALMIGLLLFSQLWLAIGGKARAWRASRTKPATPGVVPVPHEADSSGRRVTRPNGRSMAGAFARAAGLWLIAIAVASCAGTVVRPLFGMRDTHVSREQAASLVRILVVPVQLRPSLLATAQGARWDDLAVLNDERLLQVLEEATRKINAGGVHQARVADRGVVVTAEANEPQVMLGKWVKSDRASAEPGPEVSNADAILEVAWVPFAPPIRHVVLCTRLVDVRSTQILGRAVRLIVDARFPPTLEQGSKAAESAARGVGLVARD